MIQGLHHITTIAGNAQHNLDFYTKVLGLHLVKKTVHFNNPNTYHLYYGDKTGSPGSLLSFFPIQGVLIGKRGARQVNEVGLAVPQGTLNKWLDHLESCRVCHHPVIDEKFGEPYVTIYDPDGLKLELTAIATSTSSKPEDRPTILGLHHATVMTHDLSTTAAVLTDILGYQLLAQERDRYRFITPGSTNANIIDLVDAKDEPTGKKGRGIVHHIVFRVSDQKELSAYHLTIAALGWGISAKFDRHYFKSFFFRDPGGVLFGIATDHPGLTVDEPPDQLGKKLLLLPEFESRRAEILRNLPKLDV